MCLQERQDEKSQQDGEGKCSDGAGTTLSPAERQGKREVWAQGFGHEMTGNVWVRGAGSEQDCKRRNKWAEPQSLVNQATGTLQGRDKNRPGDPPIFAQGRGRVPLPGIGVQW